MDAVKIPKQRLILTVCYAAGLRVSEAVRLKPAAIDSQRMVIRVEAGKGRKDRYVMLSPRLFHVLPDRFHRIRYFGFLSNCHRVQKLALCRELLRMAPAEQAADPPADYRDRFEALTGQSLRECPHCHTGIMVVVDCIARPRVCQAVPDTS